MFIITDKTEDEELKLEEIEDSHTLSGTGRCYVVVIHQSRVRKHTMSGWVVITDEPVYICEGGGGGGGGYGIRSDISGFIYP